MQIYHLKSEVVALRCRTAPSPSLNCPSDACCCCCRHSLDDLWRVLSSVFRRRHLPRQQGRMLRKSKVASKNQWTIVKNGINLLIYAMFGSFYIINPVIYILLTSSWMWNKWVDQLWSAYRVHPWLSVFAKLILTCSESWLSWHSTHWLFWALSWLLV